METNNEFLPQDYVQPTGNMNYYKFEDGENRFRILSKPIIGWLDWDDKKPIRTRLSEGKPSPINSGKAVKHFWSFVVWDSKSDSIKIIEITQSTIQSSIGNLTKDEDWGSPFEYDIKVIKTGDGMETKYAVNPVPHKPISTHIITMVEEKPIDLQKMFDGEDPFDTDKIILIGL